MELRQLAHFLAVAEERHFTRAAQRVHLTQSSLSSSIRSLERELGSELFVRSTRRVELTEAGRALTPAARRAVAASDEARDAVAAVRGLVRGQLAIGVIQTLGLELNLPALLARYHRRHPAVTLRVQHDSVTSLVRRTADGELELAIVDLPLGPQANRVQAQALGTESLLLAAPADDRLADRRRIRLSELANRDFVEYRADSSLRTSIDRACRAVGMRRHVAAEVDTIADLVEMVAHGVGVSLLPPLAIRMATDRVIGLVTEPSVSRELLLVTPLGHPPSPPARALLALMATDSQQ
jgi:DNA-binding transcriptional LysR family regulator